MAVTRESPEFQAFEAFASGIGVRLVLTRNPSPAFLPGPELTLFVPDCSTPADLGRFGVELVNRMYIAA